MDLAEGVHFCYFGQSNELKHKTSFLKLHVDETVSIVATNLSPIFAYNGTKTRSNLASTVTGQQRKRMTVTWALFLEPHQNRIDRTSVEYERKYVYLLSNISPMGQLGQHIIW